MGNKKSVNNTVNTTEIKKPNALGPISLIDWTRFLLLEGDKELESLISNHIQKKIHTLPHMAVRFEHTDGTFRPQYYSSYHPAYRTIEFKRSAGAESWNPLEITINVGMKDHFNTCNIHLKFDTESELHSFEERMPGIKLNSIGIGTFGSVHSPAQWLILWHLLCLLYSFDESWKAEISEALDLCVKSYPSQTEKKPYIGQLD